MPLALVHCAGRTQDGGAVAGCQEDRAARERHRSETPQSQRVPQTPMNPPTQDPSRVRTGIRAPGVPHWMQARNQPSDEQEGYSL